MRFKRRKILLLIDNCAPHKVNIKLSNIKLVFFPPNVTSKLQPMDQGIINESKKYYRSILVRKIIEKMDNKLSPEIDLLEGVLTLASAWTKVKASCIENCFHHSKVTKNNKEGGGEEPVVEELFQETWIERLSINNSLIQDYIAVDDQVRKIDVFHSKIKAMT